MSAPSDRYYCKMISLSIVAEAKSKPIFLIGTFFKNKSVS